MNWFIIFSYLIYDSFPFSFHIFFLVYNYTIFIICFFLKKLHYNMSCNMSKTTLVYWVINIIRIYCFFLATQTKECIYSNNISILYIWIKKNAAPWLSAKTMKFVCFVAPITCSYRVFSILMGANVWLRESHMVIKGAFCDVIDVFVCVNFCCVYVNFM